MSRSLRCSAWLLAAAVAVVGCSSSGGGEASSISVEVPMPPSSTALSDVLDGAVSSVLRAATVRVVTSGSFVEPEFGSELVRAGSGSGFVIDESGLVVTNNHVVAGAAFVEVAVEGRATLVAATGGGAVGVFGSGVARPRR